MDRNTMTPKTVHILKTVPPYYEAVALGQKKFEIRLNDRNYQSGDIVILWEWLPSEKRFTSRYGMFAIGYILTHSPFLASASYVAFSLLPVTPEDRLRAVRAIREAVV